MNLKKYLLINSTNRNYDINYTSTNFRINLPLNININKYIKLHYMYIPKCNYLINLFNNKLLIIIGGLNIYINLPFRLFKPSDLSKYILDQVNNFSFNCIYNENDYKFYFTANTPFLIDFSLSEINKLFNLNNVVYNSDENNIFITNIINFNKPFYLNMIINNITTGNFMNTNNLLSKSTSFNIPCNDYNFGSIVKYTDLEYGIKLYVYQKNISFLDISILDDNDRIYDNNNLEWYAVFLYE